MRATEIGPEPQSDIGPKPSGQNRNRPRRTEGTPAMVSDSPSPLAKRSQRLGETNGARSIGAVLGGVSHSTTLLN